MSRYAKFIRALLTAFILGIGLGAFFSKNTKMILAAFLAAFLVAWLYLAVGEKQISFRQINRSKKLLFFVLLGLALGLLRISTQEPAKDLPTVFEAKVVYGSVPTDYGSMVVVASDKLARQTKVYTSRYPEFSTGDIVKVNVNKNELDKKYIVGDLHLVHSSKGFTFRQSLNLVKTKFINGLNTVLPEPHSTFAAGTVVGGSASLPGDVREAFRISGISHILAASGYNFTLLLIFLAYLLRWANVKKGLLISLVSIPTFAIIAGASPPVLRAATMGALANFAIFTGRISSIKSAMLWAAAILLIFDPDMIVFDLGFQLSFLATLGLVYMVPMFENMFGIPAGQSKDWQGLIFATVAAQVMTAPLIAYTFDTLSLVGLPVNFIVVPLIPFIMILSAAASAISYLVPLLGSILVGPVYLFSEFIFQLSRLAANLSWSQIFVNLPWFTTFLIYLSLGSLIVYMHKKVLAHRHAV